MQSFLELGFNAKVTEHAGDVATELGLFVLRF